MVTVGYEDVTEITADTRDSFTRGEGALRYPNISVSILGGRCVCVPDFHPKDKNNKACIRAHI
jgi:hypothetical protein